MRKQKKKVKINTGRLVMTVIAVLLIAVVGMSFKNVISLHIEQSKLKDTNEALKSDKSSLQQELKNVNDKSYIEEQARIQLRLIKPGEILYILGGNDGSSDKSKSETDKDKDGKDSN